MSAEHDDVLWRPTRVGQEGSELTRYRSGLKDYDGGADYLDLWRWSVADPGRFWESVAAFEDVRLGGVPAGPVAPTEMPGGAWFPGRTVNYAEHVLRRCPDEAIVVVDDDGASRWLSRSELRGQVAAVSAALRRLGVGHGDRVAAVLPNRAEAVVGLIACAAVGAVWSVCSPEFGADGVLSRFAQLEPKVLLLTDGYHYGGRTHERADEMLAVVEQLPSVEHVFWVDHLHPGSVPPADRPVSLWSEVVDRGGEPEFDQVPFDHPLWVLFSSGTTGAPKGIVHGHGGVLLEHLKVLRLHSDLRAGDRYLNIASTSWVVWNMLVSGLAVGATIVLLDGNPVRPDLGRVFRVVEEHDVDTLGLSAGYLHACLKADLAPQTGALRTVQVTGSPLSDDGFRWVYDRLGAVWLTSMSGGTDVCSIFVGGAPTLPVRTGRIQAPALGVAVEAWDEAGRRVVGRQGELVVTQPMPSMPLKFWNDADGRRYQESYFSTYEGVWRHGDFIEFDPDGSSVIRGRSDSTLNRQGVRMGPADIYQVVEALPEVREALVVGAELGPDAYYMPLFVALQDGADQVGAALRIKEAIREGLSPRHVPDDVVAVRGIPHTRTGKKIEVPVKRLLQGAALRDVVDSGAVDDPELLLEYEEFARTHRKSRGITS
ncbi:acetoacetate--CoA ligase [Streptomyces sp. NBC_01378]|uniref:acetoacetate--CoA ligase n=1 Tax=Streptomyces sp. NBC_01378 TaxID=2903844 RepID=UPI00324691CE